MVGVIIGIISGAICLTTLIIVGITKQLMIRLRELSDKIYPTSGVIVCPTVGGVVIGTYFHSDNGMIG